MSSSRVEIGNDRILVVNGRRFFPIGARHMPLGGDPVLLRRTGFNCIRWPAFPMDAPGVGWGTLPEDLGGLMFYPYVYNRADFSEQPESRERDLAGLVEVVRDHPALLCYEQRNEPAFSFVNLGKVASPPEGMAAGSRLIRELDPHHPIRVGHANRSLVSTLKAYNAAVDMVGCNPYVVVPPGIRRHIGFRCDGLLHDCPNQTLSAVGDFTTKMMRVAEGRPVWMQLQAMSNENWYSETHTPEMAGQGEYEYIRSYPSRWQMRFMAFNAIIRGATAVEWAMYRTTVNAPVWQEISQVIGELQALHDVLAAPDWLAAPDSTTALEMSYRDLGFGDWSGIEALVKRVNGAHWVLAANTQFDPMEATLSGLPAEIGSRVSVFGENRTLAVTNGHLTDRFQPYEVHVYAASG